MIYLVVTHQGLNKSRVLLPMARRVPHHASIPTLISFLKIWPLRGWCIKWILNLFSWGFRLRNYGFPFAWLFNRWTIIFYAVLLLWKFYWDLHFVLLSMNSFSIDSCWRCFLVTDSACFIDPFKFKRLELSRPINFVEARPMIVFCKSSARRCI